MKNILILEDDNNRITTFNQRLSKSYNLTIVKHAHEAIDLLKDNKYDLIFLDHDLNGKQIGYDEEDCGTIVAKYMNENNILTPTIIHSFNAPAADNMVKLIPNCVYIPGAWMWCELIADRNLID